MGRLVLPNLLSSFLRPHINLASRSISLGPLASDNGGCGDMEMTAVLSTVLFVVLMRLSDV